MAVAEADGALTNPRESAARKHTEALDDLV